VRVLLIGAGGQLGSDIVRILEHWDLVALTHEDLEICDFHSVQSLLKEVMPDVVINTAAFHRVDDCETEMDKAFNVNALGARNVAVVTESLGAKLVYISTDYIFGGEREPRLVPYTEFDIPVPPNVYGRSKLAGENFVQHLCSRYFIVRASGLFGVAGASGKGGNFVETMIRLGKERDELRVVDDQVFSPTCTRDLADKIIQLIQTEYYGVFHVTNSGTCSWYDFAKEIIRLAELKAIVKPINSNEYAQKAKRPRYSVMDHCHLRLLRMNNVRSWKESLEEYMIEKKHLKVSGISVDR